MSKRSRTKVKTKAIKKKRKAIPAHEAWLYQNKEALALVRRGLKAIKAGRVVDASEDFSKYIKKR